MIFPQTFVFITLKELTSPIHPTNPSVDPTPDATVNLGSTPPRYNGRRKFKPTRSPGDESKNTIVID